VITPHRSRAHLAFVRGQRCAVCPCPAAEAHHAFRRAGGGGVGLKGCDLLAVPLCVDCHRELHDTGSIARMTREQLDSHFWRSVAMTLRARLLEGES
jgi:hypothetical protein